MNWSKAYPTMIVVACLLVIIANTPAVLVDTLSTAVAQIRINAATTSQANGMEVPNGTAVTSAKKTN